MSDRTVTIAMAEATVQALQASGFHLYAFRAVTSSNKSGVPLVWWRVDQYMDSNHVSFTAESLAAYTSQDQIQADSAVSIGDSASVAPGEIARVAEDGTITPMEGGAGGAVTFDSSAASTYACGLAAPAGDAAVPFCAFLLFAGSEVVISPADSLFLMWATSTYDPGVYMTASQGAGFLVMFDGVSERDVSYDITDGWSAQNAAWATPVPPGTGLQSLLVVDPGPNKPLMEAAVRM